MTRPGTNRIAKVSAAALVWAAASVIGAAPAPAAGAPRAPVVVLLRNHEARAAPSPRAAAIRLVLARRPLTGTRTVLPVLGHAEGPAGWPWVRVALPGRPNGGTGWIRARRTQARTTWWRLSVSLRARSVTVWRLGRVAHRYRAVVGAASTPTPMGRFFVEETMSLGPRDSGSPFALATSGRSDVLRRFDGGPGQIALHGRGNLWGPLGSASSHGCIRLSDRAITWLARHIGPGVSVRIGR